MEDGKDEVENKGTGIEAESPSSTANTPAPTPVHPDDDLMRLIVANPLLAKTFTRDTGPSPRPTRSLPPNSKSTTRSILTEHNQPQPVLYR